MESRKRPRADDVQAAQSKKRALSAGRDSPLAVNGDADEPKDTDNLEMFRKDAIFRRMKYYARENERSQARISELERRRNACEAGLASLEACWAQLISTIRSLSIREKLPASEVDTHDVFDLTKHVSTEPDPSAYVEQLRDRMHATEQLVAAFVRVGSETRSQLLHDQNTQRCLAAQTECASLHAEVSLLSTRLQAAESEKKKYYEQLSTAERRFDRLQSKAVSAMNPSVNTPDHGAPKKDSPKALSAESVEPPVTAQLPPVDVNAPAGDEPQPSDKDLRDAVDSIHLQKYSELLEENAHLSAELHKAQASAKAASESQIQSSSHWKAITGIVTRLYLMAEAAQQEVVLLDKDADNTLDQIEVLVQDKVDTVDKIRADFREIISKRELETLRLREQRDARDVELKERKAREQSKIQLVNQYKQLADTREERITALLSEVGRLKGRLASRESDEDLMTFFFKTKGDVSYIADLRRRLEAAETRLQAFENTDIGEVERKERLFVATKQLERYKAIFGATSTLPPDSRAMAEELRRKDGELQALRLQLKQQEETESSMYTELERLSSAWEALDRELKSKVYDLSSMDEQMKKLAAEKVKAENKYFKAMADKATLEQQNLPYQRKIEKQAKVLEKLSEAEQIASTRVKHLEKVTAKLQCSLDDAKFKYSNQINEVQQFRARLEDAQKRVDELVHTVEKVTSEAQRKKQDLLKQEEALVKKKYQMEKQATKAKASTNSQHSNASVREAELQEEVDKCMSILKCSTCRMNMRNTVLTKCMHSFCKNCVSERIASRQRKCPACNLPFSQGEVQQLYFQ